MSAVLGLDLSLTGTGLAVVRGGEIRKLATVSTAGKKTDTLAMRKERLDTIHAEIFRELGVTWHLSSLAVVENPSYGSRFGSPHDRSGLWWRVVRELIHFGVPVATVSPQGRAKYITGDGRSKKDAVYAAAQQVWPDVQISNDNEGDALGLASMGSRYLGQPLEDLPEKNLEAMDGAAWPVQKGDG